MRAKRSGRRQCKRTSVECSAGLCLGRSSDDSIYYRVGVRTYHLHPSYNVKTILTVHYLLSLLDKYIIENIDYSIYIIKYLKIRILIIYTLK